MAPQRRKIERAVTRCVVRVHAGRGVHVCMALSDGNGLLRLFHAANADAQECAHAGVSRASQHRVLAFAGFAGVVSIEVAVGVEPSHRRSLAVPNHSRSAAATMPDMTKSSARSTARATST